jgi:rSAM/selenodomain-associated transferase 1
MLKEPRPGRVKTRLGRDIGATVAAWWYRHHAAGLIRRLKHPGWEMILAVSPDRDGTGSRVWPANVARIAQGGGNLGDRMKRMLRAAGRRPVCVIGSDIAGLERAHIARAFRALGSCDIVFGPAPDGGFWLVGVKNGRLTPKRLFEEVRWSSAHALSDSVASVPGPRLAYVDCLNDIDTAEDLRMTTGNARAN